VSATAEQLTPTKRFGFRKGNIVSDVNTQGCSWWVGRLVGTGPHIKEVIFFRVAVYRSCKFGVLSRGKDSFLVVSAFENLLGIFIWASHPGSSFAFSDSVRIVFWVHIRDKADANNSVSANAAITNSDDCLVNNVMVEEQRVLIEAVRLMSCNHAGCIRVVARGCVEEVSDGRDG